MAQCWRVEEQLQVQNVRSEPMLPKEMLEPVQKVTPPPGFQGVMACLQRDLSLVVAYEAPPDPLLLAAVVEPTVAMMSTSCIMTDEVTGITYMDTITTSMGQVALGGPSQGTQAMGPIIEDITNLP